MEIDDITIEGITVINGSNWHVVPTACNSVTIRNLNIFTFGGTGDGIDIVGRTNTSISGCFIRSNDDCIAVKALSRKHPSGCRNVTGVHAHDCVFWNSNWGNALEIGYETRCEEIGDILFENCDIIHADFEGNTSGGTFTIHNGDRALIHDVTYRDIRVEDSRQKLIDIKVTNSKYSVDDQRGQVRGIRFENIAVADGAFPPSILQGCDETYQIDNILIKNLTVHGKHITNVIDARLIHEQTSRVIFL